MASFATFSLIEPPSNYLRYIPVATKHTLDSSDNLYLVNRVEDINTTLIYIHVAKFSASFEKQWELVIGDGGYYNHTA